MVFVGSADSGQQNQRSSRHGATPQKKWAFEAQIFEGFARAVNHPVEDEPRAAERLVALAGCHRAARRGLRAGDLKSGLQDRITRGSRGLVRGGPWLECGHSRIVRGAGDLRAGRSRRSAVTGGGRLRLACDFDGDVGQDPRAADGLTAGRVPLGGRQADADVGCASGKMPCTEPLP